MFNRALSDKFVAFCLKYPIYVLETLPCCRVLRAKCVTLATSIEGVYSG